MGMMGRNERDIERKLEDKRGRTATLIQWNIRGLQVYREELSLLIFAFNPDIIALQETNIGIDHNINY